jgi:hypothetical protein
MLAVTSRAPLQLPHLEPAALQLLFAMACSLGIGADHRLKLFKADLLEEGAFTEAMQV